MGCCKGKTKKMKRDYFKGLREFATTDLVFYNEQLVDLEPKEQTEFNQWILKQK
tara:strand:+ start:99 stop:260 length:162 start_codon:yes stop_codon:yes gene_type:complete